MKSVTLSQKDISVLLRVMSRSGFEYEEVKDFVCTHSDIEPESSVVMFVPIEAFDGMLEAVENYLSNADEYGIPFLDKWETERLFDRLKFAPQIA